jgi:hypothetical protein
MHGPRSTLVRDGNPILTSAFQSQIEEALLLAEARGALCGGVIVLCLLLVAVLLGACGDDDAQPDAAPIIEEPDAAPIIEEPDAGSQAFITRGDVVTAMCESLCPVLIACGAPVGVAECQSECVEAYCIGYSLRCGDPFEGDQDQAQRCVVETAELACGAQSLPDSCGLGVLL